MPKSKESYIASYNKKSYLPVLLRITKKEKDLVEKLESAPSKNGYILSLIKGDVRPGIPRLSTIKSVLKEVLGKHQLFDIGFGADPGMGERLASAGFLNESSRGAATSAGPRRGSVPSGSSSPS